MSAILRALRTLPIYVVTGKTEYNTFGANAAVPTMDTGTLNDLLNAGGALGVTQITDITGLTAWKDYIPVQNETGRTVPFSYDANGYFPIKKTSGAIFAQPDVDPHFASVVLLCNFETVGTGNQIDQSSYARTVSADGAPAVNTGDPLWGTASFNEAVSSSTKLYRCASTTALRVGAQNFTAECVVKWDATNGTNFSPVFLSKRNIANNLEFSWAYLNGTLYFSYSTNGTSLTTVTVAWTPTVGVKYHLEIDRSGTNFYFFVDGTQVGSTQTVTGTIFGGSSDLCLIGDGANTTVFDGKYDAVRFTVGVARHTANFTPPTSYPLSA